MTVYKNAEFIPTNSYSRMTKIYSVLTQDACACQCYANLSCITASFYGNYQTCILYSAQLNEGNLKIVLNNLTSVISFPNRTSNIIFTGNLLINGDAESGPCASDRNVTSPTGWMYIGPVTQVLYNNDNACQTSETPGPSDRGNCHFYGQISNVTTMWQIGNITKFVDPLRIDNHTVSFNFSAWIGGYENQDDYALVSLTFFGVINPIVGNITTLGPVLPADRSNKTSLIYRQANGLVPVGARSFKVLVTMIRFGNEFNNGDVDNIMLALY